MAIGKMRHRITIQSSGRTSDGFGGAGIAWTDVAQMWTYAKPASVRENFRDMKINEEKSYEFTIRYKSGFDSSARIKFGTRIFNIKQIRNRDEKDKYLDILAEEGVAV